jgi:hypothetical protein
MEFLLNDKDYTPPDTSKISDPLDHAAYLKGHRAGWTSFADGMRVFAADQSRQTSLPVLAVLRPKKGSSAELAGFDAGFKAAVALNLQRNNEIPTQQAPGEWESPVGQRDRLDMIQVKEDGTVSVLLVAARQLDPSDQRTAAVLEAKLRNYCRYIDCPAFAQEFGEPTPEFVRLVLRCDWEVPQQYIELFAQVAQEEGVPAKLVVKYE